MKITVKLFANFRQERFKVQEFDLTDGTTCGAVAAQLKITEEELGVIMVNGRHAALTQRLQEGDSLSLLPLVGGG
ncbi:MAG: molybdopterin synthase sulfur carrier subunit [Desulfuromonas sp.]|nr:MAG: molybdopterin synthase sulfur carrier subunit [Desulfuromonas sp.]